MKKRLVAIMLTAVMGAALAACSSGNDGSSAADESAPVAENETDSEGEDGEQKVVEDSADDGQSSDEFNPDEENGVEIGEIRADLGAVPVSEEGVTLGAVAKSFENEYWRTLKTGYEEIEQKIKDLGYDITIDVKSPQGEDDEQGQLSIVSDMINKSYDGLLLSPISDANLVPGVESALDADIPVVNVNDGIIANAPVFVGPKADQNGELAAEWIAEQLGGEGEVAIVIGMPKAFAARQRTSGFENYVEANAPGIEIVAKQNANWDRSEAKDLADTWIKQYPDLQAIFCNNDTMAMGVVEAVKASGKDILVVGVDGTGEAYESIRAGELSATIDSFPFYKAQIATEIMLRSMDGQEIPRVVWTPQALIDSTNVDTDAAEIIGWEDADFE